MKSTALPGSFYEMLSAMPTRAGSRQRFYTMNTSFDCAYGTMARVWIRKFWRKVDEPDTGGCQVFGNERSKWEQNWIFGARREQERKFN